MGTSCCLLISFLLCKDLEGQKFILLNTLYERKIIKEFDFEDERFYTVKDKMCYPSHTETIFYFLSDKKYYAFKVTCNKTSKKVKISSFDVETFNPSEELKNKLIEIAKNEFLEIL